MGVYGALSTVLNVSVQSRIAISRPTTCLVEHVKEESHEFKINPLDIDKEVKGRDQCITLYRVWSQSEPDEGKGVSPC